MFTDLPSSLFTKSFSVISREDAFMLSYLLLYWSPTAHEAQLTFQWWRRRRLHANIRSSEVPCRTDIWSVITFKHTISILL